MQKAEKTVQLLTQLVNMKFLLVRMLNRKGRDASVEDTFQSLVEQAGEGAHNVRPIEVTSEVRMNALLINATEESIGTVYKYIGPTSGVFTSGQLYMLTEVEE